MGHRQSIVRSKQASAISNLNSIYYLQPPKSFWAAYSSPFRFCFFWSTCSNLKFFLSFCSLLPNSSPIGDKDHSLSHTHTLTAVDCHLAALSFDHCMTVPFVNHQPPHSFRKQTAEPWSKSVTIVLFSRSLPSDYQPCLSRSKPLPRS